MENSIFLTRINYLTWYLSRKKSVFLLSFLYEQHFNDERRISERLKGFFLLELCSYSSCEFLICIAKYFIVMYLLCNGRTMKELLKKLAKFMKDRKTFWQKSEKKIELKSYLFLTFEDIFYPEIWTLSHMKLKRFYSKIYLIIYSNCLTVC